MTALAQITRRKLSLLELAEELQNVSKACQIMGYQRDTFYEVRSAWLRHKLDTRHKRLLRLEREAQETTFVLTDAQIALLERYSADFRFHYVEASRPADLLNQDTFYWSTLKRVAKVYVQVARRPPRSSIRWTSLTCRRSEEDTSPRTRRSRQRRRPRRRPARLGITQLADTCFMLK